MSYGKSFNKSWQGLELQGDAWVTPPITTLRDQGWYLSIEPAKLCLVKVVKTWTVP